MKRLLVIGALWAAVLPAVRAEENFLKAVRAEDFSAAGLAKLSPDELARLDALVRDYKSGALAAARRETAAAEQARAAAEERAAKAAVEAQAATSKAKAEATKESEGLLARAKKVLVSPGTEVEIATVESRITGGFTGWQDKAIFTLENGQRWQVVNANSYYTPVIKNPAVKITPSALGGFWMTIEGVNQRVKVVFTGGGK